MSKQPAVKKEKKQRPISRSMTFTKLFRTPSIDEANVCNAMRAYPQDNRLTVVASVGNENDATLSVVAHTMKPRRTWVASEQRFQNFDTAKSYDGTARLRFPVVDAAATDQDLAGVMEVSGSNVIRDILSDVLQSYGVTASAVEPVPIEVAQRMVDGGMNVVVTGASFKQYSPKEGMKGTFSCRFKMGDLYTVAGVAQAAQENDATVSSITCIVYATDEDYMTLKFNAKGRVTVKAAPGLIDRATNLARQMLGLSQPTPAWMDVLAPA